MNWEPQDKPGFTLLHCQFGVRLYAIQKKDMGPVWRLFYRNTDDEPLRTIFVGVTLKECTVYAEIYESRFK